MKIWCPKCQWEPQPGSLWQCTCGHLWNTFQTRGVCPECGKKWQVTQCLACGVYSPHEDWYHDDDADDLAVFREYVERIDQEEEEKRPQVVPEPEQVD